MDKQKYGLLTKEQMLLIGNLPEFEAQQLSDLNITNDFIRKERREMADWLEKWLTDSNIYELPQMGKGKRLLLEHMITELRKGEENE